MVHLTLSGDSSHLSRQEMRGFSIINTTGA
jgi:hypothetical protein